MQESRSPVEFTMTYKEAANYLGTDYWTFVNYHAKHFKDKVSRVGPRKYLHPADVIAYKQLRVQGRFTDDSRTESTKVVQPV